MEDIEQTLVLVSANLETERCEAVLLKEAAVLECVRGRAGCRLLASSSLATQGWGAWLPASAPSPSSAPSPAPPSSSSLSSLVSVSAVSGSAATHSCTVTGDRDRFIA